MSDGSYLYKKAVAPTIPGDLNLTQATIADRLKMPVTSVTQLTSPLTSVSVEGSSFAVTTVPLNDVGAETSVSFTVVNSYLSAGSNIQVSIVDYASGTAIPCVYLQELIDGEVNVVIYNAGGLNLEGPLTLHFLIVNGGA